MNKHRSAEDDSLLKHPPETISPKLERLLKHTDKDIKAGKNLSRTHTTAASFLKDLHSQK